MRLVKTLFAVMILLAVSPALTQTFSDPVPYCKAVGTIDKPDARYTGPKLPGWMAKKLNMKPDQGKLMEWRCANGAVLACEYGANIPCGSKAITSQKPTQPIIDYCRLNPDSEFVPMVVTGHETTSGGDQVERSRCPRLREGVLAGCVAIGVDHHRGGLKHPGIFGENRKQNDSFDR
jgi:hypothetical protein